MVLHDRTGGNGDSFRGSNTGSGEVWGMKVVEPPSDFIGRGVGKKKADLTLDMLFMMVNI